MNKRRHLWLASLILIIIILISTGNYLRWWNWRFPVGPFSSTHWLGIIGATYIAIITPLYAYIKRHTTGLSGSLLSLHVFGNLLAFLLVSVHYTQQAGRPAEFAAVHSTGLILYIVLSIMIITGFLQRFGIIHTLAKSWRFIHVSLSLSFYIIVITHVLQFLDIL